MKSKAGFKTFCKNLILKVPKFYCKIKNIFVKIFQKNFFNNFLRKDYFLELMEEKFT